MISENGKLKVSYSTQCSHHTSLATGFLVAQCPKDCLALLERSNLRSDMVEAEIDSLVSFVASLLSVCLTDCIQVPFLRRHVCSC
jgi:hypothetical protein